MSALDVNLEHLRGADTARALEIAPRVWWVGHILEDDIFQCHVYLIEQGNQSVLLDPGSLLTFPATLEKIKEVIPFENIRYFICHHQDPDIAASLPMIDALVQRSDAVIVTHWRAQALLKHYGLRIPFWLVDQHDWRLALEDRELRFIFTPYAHFPGAICSFDPRSGVLFSSDLFGGFTERPALVAQDESYFEAMRPFHEHYMPSPDILDFALSSIAEYPVRIIAPQHGSIIPGRLVDFMTRRLSHLDCGIYLHAHGNTDIQRLSRLNTTLREITQTMLLYRDFRDIADRLCQVVSRNLPVERIDYYARLENGAMLSLTHENRFSGVSGEAPETVASLMGKTREAWGALQREEPATREPVLHAGAFCARTEGVGGLVVTLPLFSPRLQTIEAVALIHLQKVAELTPDEDQIIQQLAMPLQVALEREIIYRSIDAKRQEAYQRSIRDALTGLFNRLYMLDVMQRQCGIHDRDANAGVAAILIDIDHFKAINDTHGHTVGDEALKQVAAILQEVSRETDVPVRYGGEEFILFLIGASQDDAADLAEHLRSIIALRGYALPDGRRLPLTASLGVAARIQHEPLDDLIQRADQALYRAKTNGRNRCEMAEPSLFQRPDSRAG